MVRSTASHHCSIVVKQSDSSLFAILGFPARLRLRRHLCQLVRMGIVFMELPLQISLKYQPFYNASFLNERRV